MDSLSIFSRSVDSLFDRLGREAFFKPQSNVSTMPVPIPIKVIPRRPEHLFELGEGRIHAEDAHLEFRVSEVRSPATGDEIELDGKIYRIEEEPRLDQHQLVWEVETMQI